MQVRSWFLGVVVGWLAGLLVAIPMTIADWRLNPAGIFHDEGGTDWVVVAETAFSWFWPVALIALIATVAVQAWLTRGQAK
jgi:hypothetical protein